MMCFGCSCSRPSPLSRIAIVSPFCFVPTSHLLPRISYCTFNLVSERFVHGSHVFKLIFLARQCVFSLFSLATRLSRKLCSTAGTRRASHHISSPFLVTRFRSRSRFAFSPSPFTLALIRSRSHRLSQPRTLHTWLTLSCLTPAGFAPRSYSHGLGSVTV
ncbi:hypothetical protein EDB89DRAFT_698898 [Lactarius sanguifluus]|nr:hypothetical protein EDB89DRAFT_698898 [Lactarius sanguifluus]